MSRTQRIALVVAALAVAVVAFVVAQPGDDDEESEPQQRAPAAQTETGGPNTETEPSAPPQPPVTRIRIKGGAVVGGPKDIEVANGDVVRIVVSSDAPDELHLHGYDIERRAAPGRPARFVFRADAEGAFEMESHVAEDAGRDPRVARLVVQPS